MTPALYQILEEIAKLGRVEAITDDQRRVTDQLFDLGYLNIAPPGWCYAINAAGRAELAKAQAA